MFKTHSGTAFVIPFIKNGAPIQDNVGNFEAAYYGNNSLIKVYAKKIGQLFFLGAAPLTEIQGLIVQQDATNKVILADGHAFLHLTNRTLLLSNDNVYFATIPEYYEFAPQGFKLKIENKLK